MDANILWSLRLGFSGKQANDIQRLGMVSFLEESFRPQPVIALPDFLAESPATIKELNTIKRTFRETDPECLKEFVSKEAAIAQQLRLWWLDKIMVDNRPLREKMTIFWQNHFVVSYKKVKMNRWLFEYNELLRQNAFGNFKTLTKSILKTNAMVRYLDNDGSRKGKINENLSRELLELFTLGIGNYTEDDIKSGARGLAGLHNGETSAAYQFKFQDNTPIVYFGKTGIFKADELVDIIFEQPEIPYLLTRKILKWFINDLPDEKMVRYYGDYFRLENFEIQPLLVKIFTEEAKRNNAGTKIKDPLLYVLQVAGELRIDNPDSKLLAPFLRQQGMELFEQPNVKGWSGGREWLTIQLFSQRNNVADQLCRGRAINGSKVKNIEGETITNKPMPYWRKKGDNVSVIEELKSRLLFAVTPELQADFEKILKYDFDPNSESADGAVLRLFYYMVCTPEFQLI